MSNLLYLTGKFYCVLSIPIEKARQHGIDIESNVVIKETDAGITIKNKKAEGHRHPQPTVEEDSTSSWEREDESYARYR